jgi:hypothetical protein
LPGGNGRTKNEEGHSEVEWPSHDFEQIHLQVFRVKPEFFKALKGKGKIDGVQNRARLSPA